MDVLLKSPIFGFTIGLLAILTVPPIFERFRLPGLIGLLVAGVALGPDGLELLDAESDQMQLLSDIGKIFLMFVAGLEIDLEDFRKKKDRSLTFGLATFCIPMIFGTAIGLSFGLGLNASILVGSLLASHTLLAFPIVTRLGIATNEAITATVGATIFTDISALLVLAICISIHAGEFSVAGLAFQLGSLGVYSAIVLLGFDWAGKQYFRRTGNEESNQFLFVLLAVFLASVGAQLINVDKIIGEFLAGLAVNDVVGRSPVKEKVEFIGSTLFIPFFFVDMGLLLSVSSFVKTLTTKLGLTVAIVLGLIISKFLAALVTKWIYRYNWDELICMWSLSLPQVAATLAATLVGVQAGLLDESIFNAVIVLMFVTSVLGPVLTAKYATNLVVGDLESDRDSDNGLERDEEPASDPKHPFTVVVPVYNPKTQRYLIEMAALLARHEQGILVPVSIAKSQIHMDDLQLDRSLKRSRILLKRAVKIGKEFKIEAQPIVRIDDGVALGIARASREQNANLIIMGWSPIANLRSRIFGSVIDSVFLSSHCPVAVLRLRQDPMNLKNILVPIENLTRKDLPTVWFARIFADTNSASVTLLHVYNHHASAEQIASYESALSELAARSPLSIEWKIQTLYHPDIARGILNAAGNYDLVVLRSMRRRTAGGFAVSDVTTEVLKELNGSVVLFREPSL
ncbi:MAG: sodium:proton antiporter [Cyanobacteria bacterium J055]|nr:MAG: sodium:proton antiporter [Cyanobacteria bacterium J055]